MNQKDAEIGEALSEVDRQLEELERKKTQLLAHRRLLVHLQINSITSEPEEDEQATRR